MSTKIDSIAVLKMAANEVVQAGIAVICELLSKEIRDILLKFGKKSRKRRFWVQNWILRRNKLGVSGALLKELALEDKDAYKNHLRMSEDQFEEFLLKIKSKIQKQNTVMRRSISPTLKLQITLRYLATGDSLNTLAFMYRVPKNTISAFIKPVCEEVYEALKEFIQVCTNKK